MLKLGSTSINKAYLGSTQINKLYLGSALVFDGTTTVSEKPVLSNFRVNNATPTQVHFDSSASISGMTTTGFTISDKTISSVTVNGSSTTGHYFTVSSAFTYWERASTIKLGDINDAEHQSVIRNFTLEHIINNIDEPTASGLVRYVTTSGSSGNGGTSEVDAWDWATAVSNQAAGMTIYVKAGNYGNVKYSYSVNGTESNPIKWVGYKTTINDITTNYYDYGVTWSTSEMPTITSDHGSSSNYSFGIGCRNVIFRNFQVTQSQYAIRTEQMTNEPYNIVVERFNVKDNYIATNSHSAMVFAGNESSGTTRGLYNMTIRDCRVVNANLNGITIQTKATSGSLVGGNLIEDCKVYNDRTNSAERLDYAIAINGAGGVIKDNFIKSYNLTSTSTSTHGIGVRGAYYSDSNNILMSDNTVENWNEGLYIRNYGNRDCVIKDNIVNTGGNTTAYTGGIYFWGGADSCVAERNYIDGCQIGVGLKEVGAGDNEDPTYELSPDVGTNNIIRNNIFDAVGSLFYSQSTLANANWDDNKFYNNTVWDADRIYYAVSNVTISNFDLQGNIFDNVSSAYNSVGDWAQFSFSNNNFYNNGSWDTAFVGSNGNIDVNPNYVDQPNGDFEPQATFTSIDISRLSDSYYDYNDSERASATTIGAVKHASELVVPDTTAPVFVSAVVENASPSSLVMTYDEALDTGSVPANGDFSVNDGAANAVTNVSISGATVTLTLTNAIDNGDTVTVSYTKGANPIQDGSANEAVNLTSESVTNNVSGATELYTESSAVSIPNEANSAGSWATGFNQTLSVTTDVSVSGGTYALKSVANAADTGVRTEYVFAVTNGQSYTIKIRAKKGVSNANNARFSAWVGFSDFVAQDITTSTYTEYTFNVTANATSATVRIYPSAVTAAINDEVSFETISIV